MDGILFPDALRKFMAFIVECKEKIKKGKKQSVVVSSVQVGSGDVGTTESWDPTPGPRSQYRRNHSDLGQQHIGVVPKHGPLGVEENVPEPRVVLLAHNGKSFDFRFIDVESSKYQLQEEWKEFVRCHGIVFVDTLDIFRHDLIWKHMQRPKPEFMKQGFLYSYLFNKNAVGAHNALGDVTNLSEMLSMPSINPVWKDIANDLAFTY